MSVATLAAALRDAGVECRVESIDGVALIAPAQIDAVRDGDLRRNLLAIARAHGFAHIALELPNDDNGELPGEALSRG